MGCMDLLYRDLDRLPPPLSHEGERAMLADWDVSKQRRLEIRRELVERNLRLAVKIGLEYQGAHPTEDCIQAAFIGLMQGADAFDPRVGVRFISYASWWIRQAVSRELGQQMRTVRIPMNAIREYGQVARARQDLRTETGREATEEEIADRADVSIRRLRWLLGVGFHERWDLQGSPPRWSQDGDAPVSLEERLADPAVEAPDEAAARSEEAELVRELVDRLPERERWVVTRLYADEEPTLTDLARTLGITKERVRQIKNKALEKLERWAQSRGLVPAA